MKIDELTINQVSALNKKAIADRNARITNSSENHNLVKAADLASALGGIFYQSQSGYLNTPVEKMAGLLLFRISQRQAFENGNKRTAILAYYFFLSNHGLRLKIDTDEIYSLLHGFADGKDGKPPSKSEDDAI